MSIEQEPAKNQTVARNEMTQSEFERILKFACDQAPHWDAMNRYDMERHAQEIAAEMMSEGFARYYTENFTEGYAKGIEKARQEIISRIHAAGYSIEWIANALELPIEEVERFVQKSSTRDDLS